MNAINGWCGPMRCPGAIRAPAQSSANAVPQASEPIRSFLTLARLQSTVPADGACGCTLPKRDLCPALATCQNQCPKRGCLRGNGAPISHHGICKTSFITSPPQATRKPFCRLVSCTAQCTLECDLSVWKGQAVYCIGPNCCVLASRVGNMVWSRVGETALRRLCGSVSLRCRAQAGWPVCG